MNFDTIDHGIILVCSSGMCSGGTILTVVLIYPGWLNTEGEVGGILFDTLAIGLWHSSELSSVHHGTCWNFATLHAAYSLFG